MGGCKKRGSWNWAFKTNETIAATVRGERIGAFEKNQRVEAGRLRRVMQKTRDEDEVAAC